MAGIDLGLEAVRLFVGVNLLSSSWRLPRLLKLALAWVALASVACVGAPRPTSQPGIPGPGRSSVVEDPSRELGSEVAALRERIAMLEARNGKLLEDLFARRSELVSLQERYAALEAELAFAMEEVLRGSPSVRGIESRAFATSRIAEVRVQLESVPQRSDAEVEARIERASDLLSRADQALEQGNYGGAAFLAERGGELVRQARVVGEIRGASGRHGSQVIPIVPSRTVTAANAANLRAGPGVDHDRVGGLSEGETVSAVARLGDWIQIQTDSGERAWIHGSLVR